MADMLAEGYGSWNSKTTVVWCYLFWLLVTLPLAGAQSLDPSKWKLRPDAGKATLTFENKRFLLEGCNSIRGTFSAENDRIVASAAVSTRKGCPPQLDQLDRALTQTITKNKSYQIDGPQLTLTTSDGTTWEFTHEPMPSANAVTKFIYVASEKKDCMGVAPMKCLQVRDKPTDPWRLHYSPIHGFDFNPGIEYRLRIKEDKVARPAADQSSLVWYLDMVVEQKDLSRRPSPFKK